MTLNLRTGLRLGYALGLAAGAAACQPLPSAGPAADAGPHPALALAQGACGDCHAVERYGSSPNPDAPPFAAIVNQRELTPQSLSSWLRDAHNYPEEMDFSLEGADVDALVDYLLTLRDANYRPEI